MEQIKYYYPYISNKKNKKYMVYTKDGKWIHFGQYGKSDFTMHKDEKRKQRYIRRHERNEDWNDINTAGAWSRWFTWNKLTLNESYDDIKQRFHI